MKESKFITKRTVQELNDAINESFKEGWEQHGTLYVVPTRAEMMVQMVREQPDTVKKKSK
jgi:hypothetical protein